MTNFTSFIEPGLLVLVPVLYIIGAFIKHSNANNRIIPLILEAVGIVFAVLWVLATSDIDGVQAASMAIFTALVQGILCAGAAVYANQLYKQTKEG